MTLFAATDAVEVHHGDALAHLRTLPDRSVHAVIVDPPYGLADHHPDTVAAAITAWAAGDRERVPDGAGFMGRAWDRFVPPPAVWDEAYRVLRPGGHVAVFSGARTLDLMGISVRMAGFEVRDTLASWTYSSGMPKGMDVSKAIDRARHDLDQVRAVTGWLADAAAARGVTRVMVDAAMGTNGMAGHWMTRASQPQVPTLEQVPGILAAIGITIDDVPDEVRRLLLELNGAKGTWGNPRPDRATIDKPNEVLSPVRGVLHAGTPVLDAARQWEGWNTQLKPSHEPILLARRPVETQAGLNMVAWGTGALNVAACRVDPGTYVGGGGGGELSGRRAGILGDSVPGNLSEPHDRGRWATNVLLAHHPYDRDDECHPECHVRVLDEQTGTLTSGKMMPTRPTARREVYGQDSAAGYTTMETYGDSGGGSRFYPRFRFDTSDLPDPCCESTGLDRLKHLDGPGFRYVSKANRSERPRAWGRHPDCRCTVARPLDPETGALPPRWRARTVCAGCSRPATYRGHPTVKPRALVRWLLDLLVAPGGVVVDMFAGSGPLAAAVADRAAEQGDGTRAVLVEADEHSCRLIARRLGVPDRETPRSAPLLRPDLAPVPGETRPVVTAVEPLPVPEPAGPVGWVERAAAAGSVEELTALHAEARSAGEADDALWAAVTARWDDLAAQAAPSRRSRRRAA